MGRGARLRPALGVALSERFSQAHPFPLRGGGGTNGVPLLQGREAGRPPECAGAGWNPSRQAPTAALSQAPVGSAFTT